MIKRQNLIIYLAKKLHLKRALFKVLNYMPSFIRTRIIRNISNLNYSVDERISFSIASTESEYSEAFQLLYSSYISNNLINEHKSKMAHNVFHALPSTCLLIAKIDNKVIATMAIIIDSEIGLPIQKTWDISSLKEMAPRVAEIGSLTIHKDYQGLKGQIFLPLCAFMYRCCMDYLGIDLIVIATREEVSSFYEGLLLFKPLERKPKCYENANNKKSIAQFLDIRTSPEELKQVYSKYPRNRNLHYFLFEHKFPNFKFPKRKYFSSNFSTMAPQTLNNLFNKHKELFNKLDPLTRAKIQNKYNSDIYSDIIGGPAFHELVKGSHDRINLRYKVKCPVASRNNKDFVLDVSRTGLLMTNTNQLKVKNTYNFKIEIAENQSIELSAICCWENAGKVGLKITSPMNLEWHNFIKYLEIENTTTATEEENESEVNTLIAA